jgi:phosphoribosyl-dephospho-CoA transferase
MQTPEHTQTIEATLPEGSIIKTILDLGKVKDGSDEIDEIDDDTIKPVEYTLSQEDYQKMINQYLKKQKGAEQSSSLRTESDDEPKNKLRRILRQKALGRKRKRNLTPL